MAEDYVRKDVFDSEMSRLQSEINACNKRIDDAHTSFDRSLTAVSFIIGGFALLLAGIQVAIAFAPLIINALK